jgi:hypothetical protein
MRMLEQPVQDDGAGEISLAGRSPDTLPNVEQLESDGGL